MAAGRLRRLCSQVHPTGVRPAPLLGPQAPPLGTGDTPAGPAVIWFPGMWEEGLCCVHEIGGGPRPGCGEHRRPDSASPSAEGDQRSCPPSRADVRASLVLLRAMLAPSSLGSVPIAGRLASASGPAPGSAAGMCQLLMSLPEFCPLPEYPPTPLVPALTSLPHMWLPRELWGFQKILFFLESPPSANTRWKSILVENSGDP